jgi:heme-degrading monooxygenase HmoA
MYARVSAFHASSEKLETLGGPPPPEVAAMPGFQGAYILADRNSGKVIIVTLWETEEAMRATTEQANQIRSDMVQQAGGTGAPTVELFEVIEAP